MRLRREPRLEREGANITSLDPDFRCAEARGISPCNLGDMRSRILGFLPYSIASNSRQRWANRTELARIVLCLALLQLVNSLSPPAVTLARC